ncbi:MAG: glycogen synthase GlgA [Verrucomicrobia bacterium]|nr:glycogen synthase GlgA [Verrucomicrobiota bacterium]
MHVLLATSELNPYSKTGGLADMVAALAKGLAGPAGRGVLRISVVSPLYRGVLGSHSGIEPTPWRPAIRIGDSLVEGRFHRKALRPNLTHWFVEQPGFYDRAGLYAEAQRDYADNAARFLFLSRAALVLARHLPDPPRVVHAHDWQTGLVPLLARHEQLQGGWTQPPRMVFTIHNLAFQGSFPLSSWDLTGLPADWLHIESARHHDRVNFLKAGLTQAQAITTVSPTYAREILTAEHGCGLEGLLLKRYNDLGGILNGVDTEEWNPATDPDLPARFHAGDLSGKAVCKAAVQREMGLPQDTAVPLLANISRLTDQKGSELIASTVRALLKAGEVFQFVQLGSGERALENAFRDLARRFPDRVAARIGFHAALSHRIEAGADFYLMPSRFEPCGLNQLYSLRYGAVPVVRATGGLQDSVVDPRENAALATGIKFTPYTEAALRHAVLKALALWKDPAWLGHLRHNGMTADFSWDRQAAEYVALYESVCRE